MRILVISTGSASLKFAVIEVDASQRRYTDGRKLFWGAIDSVGGDAVFSCQDGSGGSLARRPLLLTAKGL